MSSPKIVILSVIKLTFLLNCVNPLPVNPPNLPFLETYQADIRNCSPIVHNFMQLDKLYEQTPCQFNIPTRPLKFHRSALAELEMIICMGVYNAVTQLCDPNLDLSYYNRSVSEILKDMTQVDEQDPMCDNFNEVVRNMSGPGSLSSKTALWVDSLREGFQHNKDACSFVCYDDNHAPAIPCTLIYGINKRLHGSAVASDTVVDNDQGDHRFIIDDQTEKLATISSAKVPIDIKSTKAVPKVVVEVAPPVVLPESSKETNQAPIVKVDKIVEEDVVDKMNDAPPIVEKSDKNVVLDVPIVKVDKNEPTVASKVVAEVSSNLTPEVVSKNAVNNVETISKTVAVTKVKEMVTTKKTTQNKPLTVSPTAVNKVDAEKIDTEKDTQPIQEQIDLDDIKEDQDQIQNYDEGDNIKTSDDEKNEFEDVETDKRTSNLYIARTGVVPVDDDEVSLMPWYLMVIFCVFFVYISFTNKKKIVAYVVEGRPGGRHGRHRGNGGGNRPNTANYRKLDSNLEEAITSAHNSQPSHIIY